MQVAAPKTIFVGLTAGALCLAAIGAANTASAQTLARAYQSDTTAALSAVRPNVVNEARDETVLETPSVAAMSDHMQDVSELVLIQLADLDDPKDAKAREDLTAIRAFYAMREGRPLWLRENGLSADGMAAIRTLNSAGDWGLEEAHYEIPLEAASDLTTPAHKADLEIAITKQLAKYAYDARGGRVDPSKLSFEIFVERPIIPTPELLTDVAVSTDVAETLDTLQPRHEQFRLLQKELARLRKTDLDGLSRRDRRKVAGQIDRIRLNLEFWRWLPEDLGDTHVMANIPEFKVRVHKNGNVLFEERVIVGKTGTMTPLFSDEMDHVVFRPFWGVPNSIKVKKLLPGLLRGRDSVAANGLRLKRGSRYVNPRSIDWSRNDIRNYAVYQPPGPGNALGNVKFMFPNRHAIYMHDTPMKHLFKRKRRAYSAGCVRVQDPQQFAKVLLELANDWTDDRTASTYRSGRDDQRVNFDRKLPVHLGYFTAWVDPETGDITTFDDIYKHERHLRFALAGQYNRIVRVKRSVEADVQRIRSEIGPVSRNAPNWWGGGRSSSGLASQSRAEWMREAFASD